jgi:hypothetical protein
MRIVVVPGVFEEILMVAVAVPGVADAVPD